MIELLEDRIALSSTPPSLAMLHVPEEQQTYGLTGKGYTVAIIDTGIDRENPAFAGRIIDGWNFINNSSDYSDDNGHGTHVAGIIASADANYPGIAPDVSLVILKVLDSTGTGTFANIGKALEWVAAHTQSEHIVAVNMSFGAGNYNDNGTVKDVSTENISPVDSDLKVLSDDGIFLAAASGNDGKIGLAYPASSPYVVSVGAVWNGSYGAASFINGAQDYTTYPDKICSFTQRTDTLGLLAPGAYVTSTYLYDSFASLSGTSMATPMVTAASVLVRQALDQSHKTGNVLDILQSTGVKIVDQDLKQDNAQHTGQTYSRIDVFASVDKILHRELSPDQQFVSNLYKDVLGRDVDSGGLDYWTGRIKAGVSRFTISSAIWNSAEHLTTLAKQQAADDYFENLLGRTPEPAAAKYFDSLPRQEAVAIIMASPEFARHQIVLDYENYLGREPGEQEIQYWLNSRLPFDKVAELFLSSNEFYNARQ